MSRALTFASKPARGRRVDFFLRVDDFADHYERMVAVGVEFGRPPRQEPYREVAVFRDIAGNRWDLLGPVASPSRPIPGTTRNVARTFWFASTNATSGCARFSVSRMPPTIADRRAVARP